MFKKSFLYFLTGAAVFTACKKPVDTIGTDNSVAAISITNANASSRTVNVFIDQEKVTNFSSIAPFASITGTYIGVKPGTSTLLVRDQSTAIPAIDYYQSDINVSAGQAYSFFLYDTLVAGKLKGILLTNDRSISYTSPDAKIRFLNLSPRSPALDFVAVRRQAAVVKDSVVLYSTVPYLGNVATPNIADLSAFKLLTGSTAAGATGTGSGATDYIFRVKLAGTNTVVASTAATTIVPGRNYTYFARGLYPAVTITGMLNN